MSSFVRGGRARDPLPLHNTHVPILKENIALCVQRGVGGGGKNSIVVNIFGLVTTPYCRVCVCEYAEFVVKIILCFPFVFASL